MDLALAGKRALVTGASSGLGAAAALSLAAEGVEVTINSRDGERLQSSADRIKSVTGKSVVTVTGDIGKPVDVNRILEAAGMVDILVANSGGPQPGLFSQTTAEQWQEAGDLVLLGAVNLTRGVVDDMVERKWGRLIYITSVAVLQPIDDLILSNSYRAGLTGMCKTISNTYARHGITANCVCPGYTMTERLIELADKRASESRKSRDDVLNDFAATVPAGRLAEPDELASLITFLASERAAYITGTSIPVDGGVVKALI
ncbi:MAG: SDR family oxidoreductase [Candidatus Zixiibacteriota bacterium]